MGIVLSEIFKQYAKTAVFHGLSACFPENRITCVLGPSGCGKTTLLMLLAGLESPDAGSITGLDGKRISMAFQEPRLCADFTASANIRLVNSRLTYQETILHMAKLGLHDLADKPVRAFSGGMQQRVSLLRALVADYDVLLLDEPFKGLDAETKEITMRYLKASVSGKTVICVTHDESDLEFLNAERFLLSQAVSASPDQT